MSKWHLKLDRLSKIIEFHNFIKMGYSNLFEQNDVKNNNFKAFFLLYKLETLSKQLRNSKN